MHLLDLPYVQRPTLHPTLRMEKPCWHAYNSSADNAFMVLHKGARVDHTLQKTRVPMIQTQHFNLRRAGPIFLEGYQAKRGLYWVWDIIWHNDNQLRDNQKGLLVHFLWTRVKQSSNLPPFRRPYTRYVVFVTTIDTMTRVLTCESKQSSPSFGGKLLKVTHVLWQNQSSNKKHCAMHVEGI